MKRLLLTAAFCTLLVAPAAAQDTKNEMFLGVGDTSLLFDLEDMTATIFSFGLVSYEDDGPSFQIVGGYQYRFSRAWSAGGTVAWARADRNVMVLGSRVDAVERRMWTVLAEGRWHWLARPAVDLYTGIGAGYARSTDRYDLSGTHSENDFGFQVNAIGVRFGGALGAFAELGMGWNGIGKAGLSTRF